MSAARNIKLTLAFDGTRYHGWQIQRDHPTVQAAVRDAIHTIAREPVALVGSGRTDSGTHARALVASFRTTARLDGRTWMRALNGVLPPDIRVLSARRVPDSFHAQRSARGKRYRYQVYLGEVLPPHLRAEHCHFPFPVDVAAIRRAVKLFDGEHDFRSFAKTASVEPDAETVRRIFRAGARRVGARLVFEFDGDGFLHHMVRNMVGTLLELGRGRITARELADLFEKRDRRFAGFTAPAHGLILVKVRY